MNEFELLNIIEDYFGALQPGVEIGVGDDGAVFRVAPNHRVVVSTDTMVDGIHFELSYIRPKTIGKRLVLSNISDIVAMGGYPRFILLSLIIPENQNIEILKEIFKGIKEEIQRRKIAVIGGNISTGKELSFTVTIIGELEGLPLTRDGATPGDKLYLTGSIGGAVLGRLILKNDIRGEYSEELIKKFEEPSPPLELILNIKTLVKASIDISDGFLIDLYRLIKASKVGAKVYLDKLPLPVGYELYWKLYNNKDRWDAALTGGEDYELILAVAKEFSKEIELQEKIWGRKLFCIGEITDRVDCIELINKKGDVYKIKEHLGWIHKF